jgi:hypothetical protein
MAARHGRQWNGSHAGVTGDFPSTPRSWALVAHAIVSRRDWSDIRVTVSDAPLDTRPPIAVVVRPVKTVSIEWRGSTMPSRAHLQGERQSQMPAS